MAARIRRIEHTEEVRKRIQTSQLINRLEKHALTEGGIGLEAGQLDAIKTLLRKSISDLTSTELTGELGIAVSGIERRVIEAADTDS